MPVVSMRFLFDDPLINSKELEHSNLIVAISVLIYFTILTKLIMSLYNVVSKGRDIYSHNIFFSSFYRQGKG